MITMMITIITMMINNDNNDNNDNIMMINDKSRQTAFKINSNNNDCCLVLNELLMHVFRKWIYSIINVWRNLLNKFMNPFFVYNNYK